MIEQLDSYKIKSRLTSDLCAAGAVGVGFAKAAPVEASIMCKFDSWLARGMNGELGYMHNYPALRSDPHGLLEGVQTVVSVAWPYLPPKLREAHLPYIARYAYAPDYHKSLRRILKPLLRSWQMDFGFSARICIDSAPIMERYWAVKSGVGFVGRNGCLIVPDYGSWVFLCEILITTALPADAPCTLSCLDCGACLKACPTGALRHDATVDCRKCLSALTVEIPGGAPHLPHKMTPLAGCDRCQEICPHNKVAVPHSIAQFATPQAILTLNADEICAMSDEEFKVRYGATALCRMGLNGLKANLAKISD